MKLTRSREHTINMGSYESLKVGASVELDVTLPDPINPENMQVFYDAADKMLSAALEAEVNEAVELLPAGSKSYVLSWRQNA